MISICVLTEHVFRLVHDILHLFDECLSLSRQDEIMLYLQRDTGLLMTTFHRSQVDGGSNRDLHDSMLP